MLGVVRNGSKSLGRDLPPAISVCQLKVLGECKGNELQRMVRPWCFHLQSNSRKKAAVVLLELNCRSRPVWCYVCFLNQSGDNSRKCILLKQKLGFQLVLMHFSASFCVTASTPLRSGVVCFANPGAVVPQRAGSLLQGVLSPLLVHCCAGSLRKQEWHSLLFLTRARNC